MHVMVINPDSNWRKISSSGSCYEKRKRVGIGNGCQVIGFLLVFPPFVVQLKQTPTFCSTNPSPTLVC